MMSPISFISDRFIFSLFGGGCTDSDSSDAWMSCPTPAGSFFSSRKERAAIFFVGKIGPKGIAFSLMITATTNTYNITILSLMLTRGDLIYFFHYLFQIPPKRSQEGA